MFLWMGILLFHEGDFLLSAFRGFVARLLEW